MTFSNCPQNEAVTYHTSVSPPMHILPYKSPDLQNTYTLEKNFNAADAFQGDDWIYRNFNQIIE